MNLKDYSDWELRQELKRRAAERKAANSNIPRCRNCKFSGAGKCWKGERRYLTSVCFKRPKPQCGPDRYYAINMSNRACDKYEPKV